MRITRIVIPLVLLLQGFPRPATAAGEEKPPPGPWSNSTELSYVVTQGNSNVQSFGFKDTLEYKRAAGQARLRIDSLHSLTTDDPYLQVESGLTFLPGETPSGYGTVAVYPATKPDVTRDFIEGRYEGNLSKRATWNAGASWDRNLDAGIVSRGIVFAGFGHVWRDRQDLKFRTSYGLSYTDRQEDVQDPEKEDRFPGARVTMYFMDTWGQATTYDADLTFNESLSDLSDYTADLTQGVAVNMSKKLALKVSLQFTYASEPALKEVDVIVHVRLVDPDGVPGSGDEYYETIDSGGTEIKLGEDTLRKKNLDTTFRTSLLIRF